MRAFRGSGFFAAMVLVIGAAAVPGLASGGPDVSEKQFQNFKPASEDLVLYCGRTRVLIEPLIERFRKRTGVNVAVRYASDARLVATLQEEGSASPADLYWANAPGALGAAVEAGLLRKMPPSVLERPAAFVPSSGLWTPLTVRFRVIAYNTGKVDQQNLPATVLNVPDLKRYKGRIGWTPTYASFQDFVTALRVSKGHDAALKWLHDMQKLDPKAYASNIPMIRALAAGEIDVALTNHYYVLRLKEQAPDAPIAMTRFDTGDLGNLGLITGGGILKSADHPDAAEAFLRFLLSEKSQRFITDSVHEYPVVDGVDLPEGMLPVSKAIGYSPDFDLERLRELKDTLALMREAGLF